MAPRSLVASLPAELIVEDILIRLPVKSAVRFRSVCKLWNSLFYDPKFIQNHFDHSCYISHEEDDDDDDEYLILWECADVRPRSLIILSQYNFLKTTIYENPCYFRQLVDDNMTLVGSINGLVCIANFKYYEFILWNPAIHWFKKVSPPANYQMTLGSDWDLPWDDEIHEHGWYSSTNDYMIGFGWDSSGNDYKLIAKHSPSQTTFVYSCKTDNWSELQKVVDFGVTDYEQFPCLMVRGIPYWKSLWHGFDQVLKFDVTNNQFIILNIPCFNSNKNYSCLINLYDCLALVEYDHYYHFTGKAYLYGFDEQNSTWSKIYNIDTTTEPMSRVFKIGVGEIVLNGINNYTPTMLALQGMKPVRSSSSQKLDDDFASNLFG